MEIIAWLLVGLIGTGIGHFLSHINCLDLGGTINQGNRIKVYIFGALCGIFAALLAVVLLFLSLVEWVFK